MIGQDVKVQIVFGSKNAVFVIGQEVKNAVFVIGQEAKMLCL